MWTDVRAEDERGAGRGFLLGLGSAGLIALVAFLAYRPFLDIALLGLDTFPMILTGRILGFEDFLGTFTEELMDGLYPDGHFYRPVTNLAFALDFALWKLAPRGYHLTDLGILIANGVLLSALVRKLFGARAYLGALVAGLLFVLHPIQLELVPVPPRRADALCAAFLLACLLAQPDPNRPLRGHRLAAFAGSCLALLAMGSKETGAIAVPLVLAFQFLRTGRGAGSIRTRLGTATRHAAGPFLALVLFVTARSLVLGGLGGHEGSSIAALAKAYELVPAYLQQVLYPQPIFGTDLAAGRVFVIALALALGLGLAVIWRWPGTSVVAERTRVRSGLLFLGAWTLCLLAISSLAGRLHDWYVMLFVAPYACAVGVLADRCVALLRRGRPLPTVLPLAAVLCVVANHLAYSSLVRDYDQWARASEVADQQIVRYQRVLEQWTPGRRALLDRFVAWIPPGEAGSGIRSAYLHGDHSLQAYTRLLYPDKAVHLDFYRGGPLPPSPGPDVFQVILYEGPASDLR